MSAFDIVSIVKGLVILSVIHAHTAFRDDYSMRSNTSVSRNRGKRMQGFISFLILMAIVAGGICWMAKINPDWLPWYVPYALAHLVMGALIFRPWGIFL